MNRAIKFRAWVEESEWDYYAYNIQERTDMAEWFGSPTIHIEQYTGLKDKNGKEIYEGDIVRTTNNVTDKGLMFPIGVVEFKQQAFWICNVPSERPDFTHNEALLEYWETDLEIVGNVHETPELLGGEE